VVREELTWSSADVVESELSHAWVELEEQRQRLSNSTGSTEDGDLRELDGQVLAEQLERMPTPVRAEA
jgi:hypothetical protein